MFHMFPIMGSSEFLSLRSTGLPFLQAYGLLSIQSCHGFHTPHTVPPQSLSCCCLCHEFLRVPESRPPGSPFLWADGILLTDVQKCFCYFLHNPAPIPAAWQMPILAT